MFGFGSMLMGNWIGSVDRGEAFRKFDQDKVGCSKLKIVCYTASYDLESCFMP